MLSGTARWYGLGSHQMAGSGSQVTTSIVNQVNPAAAVHGPKHVVTKGSTPVLSPAEAMKVLDSIDTGPWLGSRTGRFSPSCSTASRG